MIGTLWAMFGGAGLITKLITVGVLAVALLAAYGVWHHKVYRSGYDRAISDIAAADTKAVQRATTARSAFKACRDSGRRWDQATGTCS
jgi:hypothetical protein